MRLKNLAARKLESMSKTTAMLVTGLALMGGIGAVAGLLHLALTHFPDASMAALVALGVLFVCVIMAEPVVESLRETPTESDGDP